MKSNIKKDLKQGIPTIEIKNSGQAPNPFFQAAIRAALLCLAAFGTCLIFATTYRIPVDEYQLALFCTLCTAGLFVFFIFLKLRFAIPVLAVLCSAFLDKDKLLLYVGHFYNFFTYRLDSRLLYTSQFATLKQSQIRADYVIAGAFCLFLIVCFIYALSSRVKFIGTILITSILLLIPAFISETAVFSFGYYLLFSAMAGLYCIWVSHESTLISKPKAVKSGVMRQIIGGIPYAGNHGVQGLLTSLICVAAVFAGESLATGENSKASRFIYQIQQELVNAAANLPSLLDLGKGLQDNGYFSFGNSGEISNFIHLNAPPTGNRPVLSVKRQSNTDPLYLRGGISLDYNSAARGWTTNSKTEDISELNQLIKGYYPEMEYMFFAQRMRACFDGDTYENYVFTENVDLEYLLNTKVIFTTAGGYQPDFKTNDSIIYNLDTVLRSKRAMKNDFFQTFNLRKSNPSFGRELTYLNDHLRSEYADPGDPYDKSLVTEFSGFMAVTSFEYLDMTVSEYLNNKNKYEELIGRIYTGVPSSEKANIERLKQEINASLKYYEAEINTEIGEIEIRKSEGSEQKISGDVRDNFSLVNSAAQYFRSGYKYSLVTDNISGENTMLGNFLYETKSGHCALYATALTLYLRSEGIPARYVTGYAVDGSGTVTSDGYYQHIVTERDLHAWVEVYFKNLGWVPFDPTPPITEDVFLEAERASLSSSAAAEPFETSEPELPDSEQPDEMDTDERSAEIVDENTAFDLKTMFVFVLIVFCLLLVVVLALYIISLYKKENRLLKNFKNIKNLSSAKKASAFISSLWRAEGLIPFSSELPLDFADRVDGKIELFYTAGAKRTAEIMEKLEFSKEEPNTEEYAVLSAYVIALYKHSVLSQKTFKRLIKMMAVLTNV